MRWRASLLCMDALLTPKHVSFLLDNQVFEVNQFSESGLSLDAAAAESWSIQSLGWGQDACAKVEIRCDDSTARYPVRFRVAGLQPHCVEVAIIEMPPELRFRLRHAAHARSRAANCVDSRSTDRSQEKIDPGSRRRLILSGSEPVFNATRLRREEIGSASESPPQPVLLTGGELSGESGPGALRLTPHVIGTLLILSSLLVAVGYVLASSPH